MLNGLPVSGITFVVEYVDPRAMGRRWEEEESGGAHRHAQVELIYTSGEPADVTHGGRIADDVSDVEEVSAGDGAESKALRG